jgi:hypothetical protein
VQLVSRHATDVDRVEVGAIVVFQIEGGVVAGNPSQLQSLVSIRVARGLQEPLDLGELVQTSAGATLDLTSDGGNNHQQTQAHSKSKYHFKNNIQINYFFIKCLVAYILNFNKLFTLIY